MAILVPLGDVGGLVNIAWSWLKEPEHSNLREQTKQFSQVDLASKDALLCTCR